MFSAPKPRLDGQYCVCLRFYVLMKISLLEFGGWFGFSAFFLKSSDDQIFLMGYLGSTNSGKIYTLIAVFVVNDFGSESKATPVSSITSVFHCCVTLNIQ